MDEEYDLKTFYKIIQRTEKNNRCGDRDYGESKIQNSGVNIIVFENHFSKLASPLEHSLTECISSKGNWINLQPNMSETYLKCYCSYTY